MRQTTKTWAQLIGDLESTFNKWHRTYALDSTLKGRSASKARQSLGERTVVLRFVLRGESINLAMSRADRAVDNLAALCQIAETLRMNEVREIDDVIRDIYRKGMTAQQPRPQAAPETIPAHYRTLGVLPGAGLEVSEAAYKTLVKRHHPDLGGSTAKMQEINAAMDRVRKDYTPAR